MMHRSRLILTLATCLTGLATAAHADRIANPTAVFAGLDKITGKITSFNAKIGETVQFGALQVTPRVCYSRSSTDSPQTTTFVEVDELTLSNASKRIFTGWMFAESPGLHAVEHPVYDVWLTDCKGGKAPEEAPATASAAPLDRTKPAKHGTTPAPTTGNGDLFTEPADPNAPVD